MRKSFDDLTIADDFMFCKVMHQGMYFRVHSLTSSFEQSSKHREAKTTAIRGGLQTIP